MPEKTDIPSLCVYLTFPGNCKEAMTFYKECLGGTLSFATLDESPMAQRIPAPQGRYVLLAQLKHEMLTIMATDIVPDEGLIPGNNISLYLSCTSLPQMHQLHDAFSRGSMQSQAVHQTFFGEWFASITDRFGINWLLYHAPVNS